MEAWSTLYSVSLLLDHLQDGDPIPAPWFVSLPPALQYQLIFSGYVDAQQRLAAIDPAWVAPERLLRLHQHWATCVRQIAEGQYRDLTHPAQAIDAQRGQDLDVYEAITTQKTGAMFALAFGGVAILATTDEAHIAALTNAGLMIGMLLQFQDDRRDARDQHAQSGTLTLNRALATMAAPDLAAPADDAFWTVILAHYRQALTHVLEPLPPATRQRMYQVVATLTGASLPPADGTGGA